jgi:hypothetical protein
MKIESLEALDEAVKARKAVVVPKYCCWDRPRPAAFVINLSGAVLLRLFQAGMFLYETKTATPTIPS